MTNILPGSVATNVSRNAMTKDGSRRGKSDKNIDNGDDPIACAKAILDAVENKRPELIFAESFERELAELRHSDPEKLFEMVGGLGAQIVAKYASGDDS